MFADSAKIIIKSGKGGNGHVSFRREKYVPDGGPDGGDGGKGGDIIFEVDDSMNTLNDFRHKHKWAAENGEEGKKRKIEDAKNSKKLLEQNELSDKIKLKDFLGIQKFDTEKLREVIKVIRVHSQDEIEIEWNFDDIFSEQR